MVVGVESVGREWLRELLFSVAGRGRLCNLANTGFQSRPVTPSQPFSRPLPTYTHYPYNRSLNKLCLLSVDHACFMTMFLTCIPFPFSAESTLNICFHPTDIARRIYKTQADIITLNSWEKRFKRVMLDASEHLDFSTVSMTL